MGLKKCGLFWIPGTFRQNASLLGSTTLWRAVLEFKLDMTQIYVQYFLSVVAPPDPKASTNGIYVAFY